MRCATCLVSPSPRAKAAAHRVTYLRCADSTRATICIIDGVRDSGSYFRDSFNLESVEVLKGPSSTYFGRGSTGGIINQVSKVPRLDPSYDGIFSAGGNVLSARHHRCQPTDSSGAAQRGLPHQLHGAQRRCRRARQDRNQAAGLCAVDRLRPRHADAVYIELPAPNEDNIPDYGFPYVNGEPVTHRPQELFWLNQ